MNQSHSHLAQATAWLLSLASLASPLCASDPTPEWDYILGPLHAAAKDEHTSKMAIPILFSQEKDSRLEQNEWDMLYPLVSYDQYGKERRLHFLQLLSFSGGAGQTGTTKRTTIFPFYFRQASEDPEKSYRALFPFYGTVKNRLWRDEVKVVAFPLYVQSRKKDVVTDNYLAPFFHLRHGDNLKGWQLWPLAGWEEKGTTTKTNILGDASLIGGHKKFNIAWPFYFRDRTDLGTDNPKDQQALLPLFSALKSPLRDSITAPWPFGVTITHDREKKYREVSAPWPFIVFARGKGKTANRVWPLFGRTSNASLTSNFYAWPLYRYHKLETDYTTRHQTHWAFFLFTDNREVQKRDQSYSRRRDFWPLCTQTNTDKGERRFQALAIMEPFFPTNETIRRHYSPLWSIWTSSKDPENGKSSQSFLWDLYRQDIAKERVRGSALFGLVRWQRTESRKTLKILGIHFRKRNRPD